MWHQAMVNISWASPEAMGKLTYPQLLILSSPDPPGKAGKLTSFEEYQEAIERQKADEALWDA